MEKSSLGAKDCEVADFDSNSVVKDRAIIRHLDEKRSLSSIENIGCLDVASLDKRPIVTHECSNNVSLPNDIEQGTLLNKDSILVELRSKNKDRIIIAHLNINHLENKFDPLVSQIKDRVDILLLSETKIDNIFPTQQFLIKGYLSPFTNDRNINGVAYYCMLDKT